MFSNYEKQDYDSVPANSLEGWKQLYKIGEVDHMPEPTNEKQKRVQEIYRKRKREKTSNRTWTLVLILCLIPVLILLVTSALFDLGVELPAFFGR